MNRIFSVLALAAIVFLLVTLGIGYSLQFIGDIRDPAALTAQRWKTIHFLLGLIAGLITILVNSIAVTYFIGTGRWCREVCETYSLQRSLIDDATRLKRRTFPYVLTAILAMLGVMALGAAADPAARITTAAPLGMTWAQVHLIAAVGAFLFTGYAYVVAWNNITANQRLIQQVLGEVRQRREARGLPID